MICNIYFYELTNGNGYHFGQIDRKLDGSKCFEDTVVVDGVMSLEELYIYF